MRHEKAWGADEKERKTKTTPKQTRTKQIRFQTPCLHAIHTLWKERKARYYADIPILVQKIRSSKRLYFLTRPTWEQKLTEETFLVKRSSGDNYKREVYSKANEENIKR